MTAAAFGPILLGVMRRLLLIQVRAPGDAMAAHERACVERRLSPREVQVAAVNVFDKRPDPRLLAAVDAVVIGGSGSFSVQDPRSAGFVDELRHVLDVCLEREVPSFGICFGHQLLGLHLGADVVTDLARRESGTVPFTLTDAGRGDPLFGGLGPVFHGHTGHTDHVTSVPPGATLLATSDKVEVQALKVDGVPFYSAQFHPDLTAAEAVSRYRAFAERLPEPDRADVERDIAAFDDDRRDTDGLLGAFVDRFVGSRRAA